MAAPAKRSIEVELDEALLRRAEEAGIDLPRTIDGALRSRLDALDAEDWAGWNERNREAIRASNRYVEEHGLPLAKYRLF